MFKSKEHEAGFDRLRKDYDIFQAILGDNPTRLLDKTFDRFEEECWDNLVECLDQDWLDKPHVELRMENADGAGSLDGLFEVVDFYTWARSLPRSLIEAYEGYYEDEMARDLTSPMEEPEHVREWVLTRIYNHNPRERLAIYLEWNGILGWTNQIIHILLELK